MTIARLFAKLLSPFHRRRSSSQVSEDLVLGVSAERNSSNPFVVWPAALRAQHMGIVGLSGNGKTYFIEHMIRQDIKHKTRFALFDVHGDIHDSVLAFLAERASVGRRWYVRVV